MIHPRQVPAPLGSSPGRPVRDAYARDRVELSPHRAHPDRQMCSCVRLSTSIAALSVISMENAIEMTQGGTGFANVLAASREGRRRPAKCYFGCGTMMVLEVRIRLRSVRRRLPLSTRWPLIDRWLL